MKGAGSVVVFTQAGNSSGAARKRDLGLLTATYERAADTQQFQLHRSPMPAPQSRTEEISDRAPGSLRSLQGVKIVAIDDDPVALRALEMHLTRLGGRVRTCDNGSEGLELIDDEVSVALIDMRMPGSAVSTA